MSVSLSLQIGRFWNDEHESVQGVTILSRLDGKELMLG